ALSIRQLLDLVFETANLHAATDYLAVLANQEQVWQDENAVAHGQRTLQRAGLEEVNAVNPVLIDEVDGINLIVIQVDAHKLQSLAAQVLLQRFQLREVCKALSIPACPIVDDNDLSA